MKDFSNEISYEASRSSGKGGQNVNKVSTKVTLKFDVKNSALLSDADKDLILRKLKNRISSEGILRLSSQSERSQHMNKKLVTESFYNILEVTLRKKKKRIKTKPTHISSEQRLKIKKIKSEIKKSRKKVIE